MHAHASDPESWMNASTWASTPSTLPALPLPNKALSTDFRRSSCWCHLPENCIRGSFVSNFHCARTVFRIRSCVPTDSSCSLWCHLPERHLLSDRLSPSGRRWVLDNQAGSQPAQLPGCSRQLEPSHHRLPCPPGRSPKVVVVVVVVVVVAEYDMNS